MKKKIQKKTQKKNNRRNKITKKRLVKNKQHGGTKGTRTGTEANENLESILRESGAFNNDDNNRDPDYQNRTESQIQQLIGAMFEPEQSTDEALNTKKLATASDDFPKNIADLCDEKKLYNVKELMQKMLKEAKGLDKPKNPFKYEYKPYSKWKEDTLSSPETVYNWYVSKNPQFIPIIGQKKDELEGLEIQAANYLEVFDRNQIDITKQNIALLEKKKERESSLNEEDTAKLQDLELKYLKLTDDWRKKPCIEQLKEQFDARLKGNFTKETFAEKESFLKETLLCQEPEDSSPKYKIAGGFPMENTILASNEENSTHKEYPVIKVPEYEFLIMGMVKDLLLIQFEEKMPQPKHKIIPKDVNNKDERNSKKLFTTPIREETRILALQLLTELDKFITSEYVYAEFIDLFCKFMVFMANGKIMPHAPKLRAMVAYFKSTLNTCFIILPTFEQINFKKVINICAAPVLNLRVANTRIITHNAELSLTDEMYHDMLVHGFSTHHVTKYIPGFTGQYLGVRSFMVRYNWQFKYQPSKISCLYATISRRLQNIFPCYNYSEKAKNSKITGEELEREIKKTDSLSDEEKYALSCILFLLFHEFFPGCLHDLHYSQYSIKTQFNTVFAKSRQSPVSKRYTRFYNSLSSEFNPQYMVQAFSNKKATELDSLVVTLFNKLLSHAKD